MSHTQCGEHHTWRRHGEQTRSFDGSLQVAQSDVQQASVSGSRAAQILTDHGADAALLALGGSREGCCALAEPGPAQGKQMCRGRHSVNCVARNVCGGGRWNRHPKRGCHSRQLRAW